MTKQLDNEVMFEKVKEFLVDTGASLLKIRNMDIDRELEQYGFDSISNTEFANKINDYYKIDIMPTIFFEFEESTIRSLANYLCDKYAQELRTFYAFGEKEEPVSKMADKEMVIPEQKVKPVTINKPVVAERKYIEPERVAAEPFEMGSRFIHSEKREAASRFIHLEKQVEEPVTEYIDREREPIAIIGMQGAFPHSENLDEFWNNLSEGKKMITEVPIERFDWKEFENPTMRWGGFLSEVDKFDADFFGITEKDAQAMDPQHRLFVETAWGAIEDAGYRPSELSGTKTGIFIGIGTRDYAELMDKNDVKENEFFIQGRSPFMLPNRLSSILNVCGPCEAIDTACSSSLVAIHKAVESIHIGSSEIAIAGGVNIILTPSIHMAFSDAGMLSESGECRVFDKDADGTVRSEGVGAVILKRLSDAKRDGDHIYGLIKATSQNHKGKSASLTAPKANAEADLIKDVFHKADVLPSTVNYIEAHSTGSKLTDPVEIAGLKKAFKELNEENGTSSESHTCAISSLKANVGHLEAASGIGALIKVLLSLQHKQILGVVNYKELNPYIDLNDSPFYINDKNSPWERVSEDIPRRAGISAFGFGGVNAHVMIEEYMEEEKQSTVTITKDAPAVILLSGKNEERLKEQARLLVEMIEKKQFTDDDLASMAYTLQVGRDAFEERLAFTAVTMEEVKETLAKYIQGEHAPLYQGRVEKKNDIVNMLEEDSEIIYTWLERRDYNKLIKLWVSGCKIDWNVLYQHEFVKRISLPTYPFEKKHYWLEFNSDKKEEKIETNEAKKVKKLERRLVKKKRPVKTGGATPKLTIPEVEKMVHDIWAEIIGNDDFTLEDGFFEIGVDSVTASIIVDQINEKTGCQITVTNLFEYSNMRALSAFIVDLEKEQCLLGGAQQDKDCDEYEEYEEWEMVEVAENSTDESAEESSENDQIPDYYENSVAVIGLSCKVPGAASYEEFWNNLIGKKECSKYLSREEQTELHIPKEIMDNPNYVPVQFTVEGKDQFDPGFFKISPKDAEAMGPNIRNLLQASWSAVEDAGYIAAEIPNTAVYMSGTNNYYYRGCDTEGGSELAIIEDTDNYVKWLYSLSGTLPTLISYKLGLKGPSYFVHSNCSSGLVAMYQAYNSICQGKVDYALVGASSLNATPNIGYMYFPGLNSSSDGHVKTFDASADGMVAGEGTAVVLLKNAKKAVEDGDHIYGILRGIELNNDGADKAGFYAPSVTGQAAAIKKTLEMTHINPETISYVETHGTGTKLGDPIEFSGLCNAYREYTDKKNYCGIGSVKTNVGHLDTAAGVIGCIKLVLSLYHKQIPASINFKKINEGIDIENSPFYVVSDLKRLEEKELPYRAALSSLGIGGTNAHAIFEEFKREVEEPEAISDTEYLVPLSAKTEERLKEYAKNIHVFLSGKEDKMLTIRNIAYTFQTGRTPMNKRVIFVVKSLEDLKEKLSIFLAEQKDSEKILRKSKKGEAPDISCITEEDISGLVEAKEFSKIASYWVNGANFNWKLLYEGEHLPYKVILPTYPFAKERYWRDTYKEEKMVGKQPALEIKRLHPLIDENISDLMEQKYCKRLNGDEYFVADHVFNGQKVLPGVVHIEMARAACEFAMRRKVHKLKNIVWTVPIVAESPRDIEIAIAIKEKGIAYQIRSEEDGTTVLHSQGRAEYEESSIYEDEYIDIQGCRARCNDFLGQKVFYETNNSWVYYYGESYQALKEAYIGNNEVISIIEVPDVRKGEFKEFTLHPSLLEGCLHATGTLMHKKGVEPFMPFSMDEVEILHELTEQCYVYATFADARSEDSVTKKFNIWIADMNGRVLVKIKNYAIRIISPGTEEDEEQTGRLYFQDKLEKSEPDVEMEDYSGNYLVFDDDSKICNCLRKKGNLIQVKAGEQFRALPNRVYEINPSMPEHYTKLFKEIKANGLTPNRIVYHWKKENGDLDRSLENSVGRLFHISKTMICEMPGEKVTFLVINDSNGRMESLFGKALNGVANTVNQENSKYHFKAIELRTDKIYIDEVLDYEFSINDGDEVCYTEEGRFVRKLSEYNIKSLIRNQSSPFRHHGVYLITGGMGKIAGSLAEYLAEKYQARLVLIGRSKLSDAQKKRMDRMKQLGGEVLYVQADISKRNDVQTAVKKALDAFHVIHGVFHCAGTIRDRMLKDKTYNDFVEVVSAKVKGVIYLDEALQMETLDFFTMFSSTSYLGSAGQADYAYANSFLNKFADYRKELCERGQRYGTSLSISWPFWQDGGMKMGAEKVKLLKNIYGVEPLPNEAGLNALEEMLLQRESHIILQYGQIDKIRKNNEA